MLVDKHTDAYLTAYSLNMICRSYQITLQWNVYTQIKSGTKC